eukprot:g5855.t1
MERKREKEKEILGKELDELNGDFAMNKSKEENDEKHLQVSNSCYTLYSPEVAFLSKGKMKFDIVDEKLLKLKEMIAEKLLYIPEYWKNLRVFILKKDKEESNPWDPRTETRARLWDHAVIKKLILKQHDVGDFPSSSPPRNSLTRNTLNQFYSEQKYSRVKAEVSVIDRHTGKVSKTETISISEIQSETCLPNEDYLLSFLQAAHGDVSVAVKNCCEDVKNIALKRWSLEEEEAFYSAFISSRGDFLRMLRKYFSSHYELEEEKRLTTAEELTYTDSSIIDKGNNNEIEEDKKQDPKLLLKKRSKKEAVEFYYRNKRRCLARVAADKGKKKGFGRDRCEDMYTLDANFNINESFTIENRDGTSPPGYSARGCRMRLYSTDAGSSQLAHPWFCPTCTFINYTIEGPKVAHCRMCGAQQFLVEKDDNENDVKENLKGKKKDGKNLNENQRKTIRLLAKGYPIINVAALVGIRRETIWRWKQDSTFITELKKLKESDEESKKRDENENSKKTIKRKRAHNNQESVAVSDQFSQRKKKRKVDKDDANDEDDADNEERNNIEMEDGNETGEESVKDEKRKAAERERERIAKKAMNFTQRVVKALKNRAAAQEFVDTILTYRSGDVDSNYVIDKISSILSRHRTLLKEFYAMMKVKKTRRQSGKGSSGKKVNTSQYGDYQRQYTSSAKKRGEK